MPAKKKLLTLEHFLAKKKDDRQRFGVAAKKPERVGFIHIPFYTCCSHFLMNLLLYQIARS